MLFTMGRHKEWRKIVKKERRRRKRISEAKKRETIPISTSQDECYNYLCEQESLELFMYEEIERSNKLENEKWVQAELQAMEHWKKLQEKRELIRQKELELQAKLKLEWEMEKQRKEKEAQRLKEIEENNKRKQEEFIKNLEKFLSGEATEPPPEILVLHESKPNCEPCPFFSKTAACRFGDECSRNHKYPGISKILLATNLFTHFGLDNTNVNEYDTDIMLEYEDNDTYKDFKEFFYDVLPEFQKFGKVVQFKVCNNHEKHLRGNTYVEYEDLRSAVQAYRGLHTRWYGGKQLSLQFCQLSSWKNAICGLQSRQRCPKGRACNFMHVFRNPARLFTEERRESSRRDRESVRSWRWSESPERRPERKSSRNDSENDRHKESRHRRRTHRTESKSHRKH